MTHGHIIQLTQSFPILHAEGFSFSVWGGNKLRVQDLFRFSFENDLSGCFLKRETPRDLKKRGTKMQCVLLGIFLRMPKNLQPHGKHLQLLNDLKFPASLETDQNLDVDKSWWEDYRLRGPQKDSPPMQLPFMPPPPKAKIFFSWIFFSIWRCVSSRKSKCQTFGKMPNFPPRHCEKNSESSNWIAFCQCILCI